MRKRTLVGSLVAGAILISAISGNGNKSQPTTLGAAQTGVSSSTAENKIEMPTCDGKNVKASCMLDGVKYATYVYQPAVPEKSHDETVTTYKQEVSGYCTLCSDGTYSPTCAAGRGACSHHGGVAQWNAPRYSNVPQYTTKKVVDAPAQEAYYQKATQ